MPVRRRKRRSRWNPLGWLSAMPPALEATTRLVAVIAGAATPSVLMAQRSEHKAEDAQEQTQYANLNTNAALAALSVLSYKVERLEIEVARLKRHAPAAMMGPAVPDTWLPQPPKKKPSWKFWQRG